MPGVAVFHLPPCSGCKAAVALLATWISGCYSRPTFRLPLPPRGRSRPTRRLAVDARRLSPYLLPWSSLVAADAIPAASPWMRGGSRLTCRIDDLWRPKSPTLSSLFMKLHFLTLSLQTLLRGVSYPSRTTVLSILRLRSHFLKKNDLFTSVLNN